MRPSIPNIVFFRCFFSALLLVPFLRGRVFPKRLDLGVSIAIFAALLVRGAARALPGWGGMGLYFWVFSAIALTGALRVWQWSDGGRLKPISVVKSAGEAALHLESHD